MQLIGAFSLSTLSDLARQGNMMEECEDSGSHNDSRGAGGRGLWEGGGRGGGSEHSHPEDEAFSSVSPCRLEDASDRGSFIKRTSNSLIDSF